MNDTWRFVNRSEPTNNATWGVLDTSTAGYTVYFIWECIECKRQITVEAMDHYLYERPNDFCDCQYVNQIMEQ